MAEAAWNMRQLRSAEFAGAKLANVFVLVRMLVTVKYRRFQLEGASSTTTASSPTTPTNRGNRLITKRALHEGGGF